MRSVEVHGCSVRYEPVRCPGRGAAIPARSAQSGGRPPLALGWSLPQRGAQSLQAAAASSQVNPARRLLSGSSFTKIENN